MSAVRSSPIFDQIKAVKKGYKNTLLKLEMIEDISSNFRFDTTQYKDAHKNYTHRSLQDLVEDINKSKKGNEINSVIELYRRIKKKVHDHLDQTELVHEDIELRRINESFNKEFTSIKFLAKGEGGTVFTLNFKGATKPLLVLKVANSLEASVDLVHEALVSAVLFSARLTTKNFVFSFFPNFLAHAKTNRKNKDVTLSSDNLKKERYCMISQFVQGKPIDKVLKEYKLESNKRQIIFATLIQLANSLVKAQRHCLFMHYDLHTHNVLLGDIEQEFEVKFAFSVPKQTTKSKIGTKTKFVINIIDFGQSVVKSHPSYFDKTPKYLKVIRPTDDGNRYHQFRDNQFEEKFFYQGYDFLSYLIFLVDDLLKLRQIQLASEILYAITLWFEACKVCMSPDMISFMDVSSNYKRFIHTAFSDYFFLKNTKKNREMCAKLDVEKFFYALTLEERDESFDNIHLYRNLEETDRILRS
jgi:hypothetical protein